MRILDNLISARFMSTFGHLTALLILFATIENNIEQSIGDGASKADAMSECQSALVFGTICFAIDFSGIFFGNSLFSTSMNILQIFFHATGSILLSWLITQNWGYTTLWPIVACTSIVPALFELAVIVSIYVLKINTR
jgi:hypothetical protein